MYPEGAGAQVPSADEPSAPVHTSQGALHEALQQTPSAAYPLAQALAEEDFWPVFRPHVPEPLQVEVLAQSPCGSVPTSDGLQEPLTPPLAWRAAEHASHAGHFALPQHTPSTQLSLAHSRQL